MNIRVMYFTQRVDIYHTYILLFLFPQPNGCHIKHGRLLSFENHIV